MLSFSAAVSPDLRALMEKELDHEWVALRRLQNVPEGDGAEAWKALSEHYEPKTATKYVGMLKQILLYDFGELTLDRAVQTSGQEVRGAEW